MGSAQGAAAPTPLFFMQCTRQCCFSYVNRQQETIPLFWDGWIIVPGRTVDPQGLYTQHPHGTSPVLNAPALSWLFIPTTKSRFSTSQLEQQVPASRSLLGWSCVCTAHSACSSSYSGVSQDMETCYGQVNKEVEQRWEKLESCWVQFLLWTVVNPLNTS